MTVNCLTAEQKKCVLNYYNEKTFNQKSLANMFYVSERSINRVLIESGVATPVERIKGEAYLVMQLLKKYQLDYEDLKYTLGTLNVM